MVSKLGGERYPLTRHSAARTRLVATSPPTEIGGEVGLTFPLVLLHGSAAAPTSPPISVGGEVGADWRFASRAAGEGDRRIHHVGLESLAATSSWALPSSSAPRRR